jgi:hypothetical protein
MIESRGIILAGLLAFGVVTSAMIACVPQQPPVDTELSNLPTAATPVATTSPPAAPAPPSANVTAAYTPDLQPVFQSDCVRCHSGSRPDGNYSMQTYMQVMRAVVAGNARSRLVVTTQSNGSMYRYLSGDRAAKSTLIRRWVVDNNAAQQR